MNPTILLSFDVEEYDMPMEYKGSLSFENQLAISTEGMNRIIPLLDQYNIKATFYTTAQYALHQQNIIHRLVQKGHEIGSHGYYHSNFKEEHLEQSRKILMDISNVNVYGYRMARMMPVSEKAIAAAGYLYNSSLNPTWLPGRYNHLNKPRTYFYKDELLQLPASVTPFLRIPLFWIAFRNFPERIYRRLCNQVLKKDQYCNIYFHPWEWTDIKNNSNAKYPTYITRNTGEIMVTRLEKFITWALQKKYTFTTTIDWLIQKKLITLK